MFKGFINLSNILNEKRISSYSDYEELKNNNQLDDYVNEYVDLDKLRNDLYYYLKFIFDTDEININYKKLQLEKLFNIDMMCGSEYLMCLYCNNLNAYRNYPLLLFSLSRKLNIFPFNMLDENKFKIAVCRYYNVKEYFNLNYNHIYCELDHIYTLNEDKYKEQELLTDKGNFENYINVEEFFYNIERQYNKDAIWVSKYYGDGFGYDVYSKDIYSGEEKLIEIKSISTSYFILTNNEFRVMCNTAIQNASYHVYLMDKNTKEYRLLKFVPSKCEMLDEVNNEYYDFEETIDYETKNTIYIFRKKEKILSRGVTNEE